MSKFLVERSKPLKGEVIIEGAKNSALPILAGCILSGGINKIENIPKLSDVLIMCELLENLGAVVTKDFENKCITIDSSDIINNELPYNLVKQIRASFLFAGALLARKGHVKIQMPGGCPIGIRPIDLHLKGFSSLGAEIKQEHGIIDINCKRLKGSEIYLDFPSVGATENLMMAASMAEGVTVISNCAVEPEIVDLAVFLNSIGCKIEGAGCDSIKITGVKEIGQTSHRIIPDRIEAATFMVAAAATKGSIEVKNICCEHLRSIILKLREINVSLEEREDKIFIDAHSKFKNTDIKTLPYPGFPTDMQPQFMSFLSTVKGTGIINETIFENRFIHVAELSRMGADIRLEGRSAIVQGVDRMTGTQVKATDLRAGAGLIIAGLCAEGMSEIGDIYHIERGYYKIEEKLKNLGAKINRIDE